MSNEDLNDLNWKSKLEDVSSLPGETVTDKNAAWEKLHSRLGKKPYGLSAVWYWAAACLFFAILIPVILINTKEVAVVRNSSAQIKVEKASVPQVSQLKVNSLADVSTSLIKEKKISQQTIKISQKKYYTNIIEKKKELLFPGLNDQNFLKPKAVNPSAAIDSTAVTAIIMSPVKKKLKVVHINELGNPVAEPLTTARHYERRSFEIKLFNYTDSPFPSPGTGFNLLKTKNVPSN